MIGTKIGRYEITAKLGEGGMGSVWKAEDPLLGRTVALKFLPPAMAESESARDRFLREARAASGLKHPGIATVHDAGEEGGQVWIAFEHVDGETVADRASRGALPLDEAADIAREAADALEHAHSRGVLHRDVTGRNVMVDRDGHARIVDFGLALPEAASRVTRSGTTLGTVAYVAPEVIAGRDADRRSDVYGLGVVLYEMLTGRLPFEGERAEAVLYAATHEEPAPPSAHRDDLPRDVDGVVLRALAKDPDARYQSAAELGDAVSALLDRSRPRWRAPALAALGLLLIAGAVGAWRTWLTGPGAEPAYTSVAVLPLANLSDDPDESYYLSDAIGEVLTTRLTQLEGLRVTPWVTALRQAGTEAPPEVVAENLGVDALLAGQFRALEGRVQGSLALVDGGTGEQVWAERFEEPLQEGFMDVIRSLAVSAGERLRGRLDAVERESLGRPLAASFEAYDLFLQGSDLLHYSDDRRTFRIALRLFEQAVELDPDLAPAYVGIGTVHKQRYFRGWGGMASLDAAEESFRKALELDPGLIRARGGMVRVYWDRGRAEDCLQEGKLAEASAPGDVDALLVRAEAYVMCGLTDRAIAVAERALDQDPMNAGALFFLFMANAWTGLHEEAIRNAEEFEERFTADPEMLLWTALCHLELEQDQEARREALRAVELAGHSERTLFFAASVLKHIGEPGPARDLLLRARPIYEEYLEENPDNARIRIDFGGLLWELGDEAGARRELERALRDAPENGYLRLELGWQFLTNGDTDRGLEEMRASMELGWIPSTTTLEALFPEHVRADPRLEEFWRDARRASSRARAEY